MVNDIEAKRAKHEWLLALTGNLVVYALPPLSLLAAILLLALGQRHFLILSIYMIIPAICAPVAYLALRRRGETGSMIDDYVFKMLVAGFLFCFAFSVLLLYAFEIRPLAYYIAVAAMATIIFLQIARSKITRGKSALILLQIAAMSLNISWGVTLKYFEFVGRTDILPHAYYTESLIQLGHVTPVFFEYQSFPLWHIMSAGISLAGGGDLPAYKVMAIAGALAFAMLPSVTYLIGNRLFGDDRMALSAALIISFSPSTLFMGMSTIARVVAQVLMAFLLYALIAEKGRARYLLIVPLTVAILLYHSVSILFVILLLIIIYALQALFVKREERFVSLKYIVFATVLTAAYWLLNANIMIRRLINNATAQGNTINLTVTLVEKMPWNELANYLQYSPFVLLILAGAILLLRSSQFDALTRVFGLVALALFWLSFPGPLQLFGRLAENLGIERLSEYTFLFLALASAAGVACLYRRAGRHGKAAVVMLFAVWVLLSVSNDWVASDNPLVKRPFYTYYFSEQEITGMDRLVVHTTGMLLSDYIPNRYYESSPYEPKTTILQVDMPNMTFLRRYPEDVLLIRDGEHDKRELRAAAMPDNRFKAKPEGNTFQYIGRDESVWDTLSTYSRIYDSRAIRAYV